MVGICFVVHDIFRCVRRPWSLLIEFSENIISKAIRTWYGFGRGIEFMKSEEPQEILRSTVVGAPPLAAWVTCALRVLCVCIACALHELERMRTT